VTCETIRTFFLRFLHFLNKKHDFLRFLSCYARVLEHCRAGRGHVITSIKAYMYVWSILRNVRTVVGRRRKRTSVRRGWMMRYRSRPFSSNVTATSNCLSDVLRRPNVVDLQQTVLFSRVA